jgi:hypothetical protein
LERWSNAETAGNGERRTANGERQTPNGERGRPSGVPQLTESVPEIREKIRRQHRLLGRMTYRNLSGSAAKPGAESSRIIGRNLPCEESGANAGQDVA